LFILIYFVFSCFFSLNYCFAAVVLIATNKVEYNSAQMAIFASFLRPVFQTIRVQRISDLRSKFAICVEVW